jgi:RimJ/RimL family protein N-acetyltransferase
MIETERLVLRQNQLEDFEQAYAIYSDPEVVRHIGNGKPGTQQDVWFRLLRFVGHWQLLGYGMFAIVDKESGRMVGETGFADFKRGLGDDFDRFPEAAWILASDMHGKGYALEAATAAHRWFEDNHGTQRTVCIIDPPNTASIRLAGKLGYRLIDERPFREATVLAFERQP